LRSRLPLLLILAVSFLAFVSVNATASPGGGIAVPFCNSFYCPPPPPKTGNTGKNVVTSHSTLSTPCSQLVACSTSSIVATSTLYGCAPASPYCTAYTGASSQTGIPVTGVTVPPCNSNNPYCTGYPPVSSVSSISLSATEQTSYASDYCYSEEGGNPGGIWGGYWSTPTTTIVPLSTATYPYTSYLATSTGYVTTTQTVQILSLTFTAIDAYTIYSDVTALGTETLSGGPRPVCVATGGYSIPGFPWESILAGLTLGICIAVLLRRSRK